MMLPSQKPMGGRPNLTWAPFLLIGVIVYTIKIEQLKVKVKLGCDDCERSFPQSVLLNLTLDIKDTSAATSDDLTDTFDYRVAVACIESMAQSGSWKLSEKLAADIGYNLLECSPLIERATVGVTKNIIANASGVTVTHAVKR